MCELLLGRLKECVHQETESTGGGDNYFVDVYRFTLDIDDSDVNFQEAEIDGYMFASIDEIKVFAQEGIFLHYDSIKKVFE